MTLTKQIYLSEGDKGNIRFYSDTDENAINFSEKFMSLTPTNQRFPYDEEGKIIESATTMYQIAEKRVKKIREEDFFRNGAPDDFFVVPKKIDIKKDTVASKQ